MWPFTACNGNKRVFTLKFLQFRHNPLIFVEVFNDSDAPLHSTYALAGNFLKCCQGNRERDAIEVTHKHFLLYLVEFAEEGTIETETDHFYYVNLLDFIAEKKDNEERVDRSAVDD